MALAGVSRTNFANAIPVIWEPVFEYKAQAPRGVADLAWNLSDRVQGKGNEYRINILTPIAANTSIISGMSSPGTVNEYFNTTGGVQSWDYSGAGGSVNYAAAQTPKLCTMKLRLNDVGITVDPDVNEMAVADMVDAYTPLLIEHLYQSIEVQLCYWAGLAANFALAGGATNVDFTAAQFALTLQKLMKAAGDKLAMAKSEINAVFALNQLDHILAAGEVTNAATRGTKNDVLVSGRIGELYGVPLFLTTNVQEIAAGTQNFLFGRKALAWGRKYNAKIETDRQDLITKVIAYCTWGVCAPHSTLTLADSGVGDLLARMITYPAAGT